MRTILEEGLFRFIGVLERLKIDYTIIGAIASGIYGLPRTTYDIDIILKIEKIKIPSFLEGLKDNGFRFEREDILKDLKDGYLSEVHYQNIRIDILLPVLPYFKKVIKRGVIFNLSGNDLKFAQAEDVVILKLLSNREKDREDIQAINQIHTGLDIGYIKDSLLRLVGEKDKSYEAFKQIFEL